MIPAKAAADDIKKKYVKYNPPLSCVLGETKDDWCSFRLLLFCPIVQVTLSGFVSVFFEKVLKSRVVNLSVWDRNYQVLTAMCLPFLGLLRADSWRKTCTRCVRVS